MIDELAISVNLVHIVKDAIIGPTGGLMALCFAGGAYSGWRFCAVVLVKKYIEEVQSLKSSMLKNEEKCAKEISDLGKRMQFLEDSRVSILSNNRPQGPFNPNQ